MTRTVPLLLWILAVLCQPVQAEERFPFIGVVTPASVNVRAGQNENFEKVGLVSQGDKVVVVDRSFSWYKIKLPATADSYVSAEFVKELSRNIGKISANRLNIRAGKGLNYSVVGQLEENQLVRILKKDEEWFKIEPIDKSYGWILAEYVQFQSEKIPPPRQVEIPDAPGEPPTTKRVTISDIFRKAAQPSESSEPAAPEPAVEEPAPSPVELIQVSGMLTMLGEPVTPNVRHQIIMDDKTEYYLLGYRRIIDGFINQKVSIEGVLQKDVKAVKPVLLVTKIKLYL